MDQAILIDLDSLLDTRIATISKINPDAAVKAVLSKDYYVRMSNDFTELCGISVSEFNEAFAKRDVETLKNSFPSSAIIILNTMINDLADQHVGSPYADDVKIAINTYPYELSNEELESIRSAIAALADIDRLKIDMVRMPWESITPQFIKANYTGLLFYNFREWMECQSKNFLDARIPEILILAPALYLGPVPEQSETLLPGAEQMSPFEITEGMLVGCFDLTFIGVQHFSLIPPQAIGTPIAPGSFKKKKKQTA